MSARAALGVVLAIGGVVTALIAVPLPGWLVLLLGSVVFAGIYMFARLNSRYDPLDPRFGSCIPPIQRHKRIDE